MSELIVRVAGVEHRLSPGQAASLGRAATNTIVCAADAVSGTHAHIAFEAGSWVFRDASTNGSFVNGQRTPAFTISAPVSVVLGDVARGVLVELLPTLSVTPASPPPSAAPSAFAPPPSTAAEPPPPPAVSGGFVSTQILPKELGGTPAVAPPNPASDVKIQYEGGEFVARPGQVVTFGREPSSLVMLDNPTVSRRHAHLFLTSEGWVLEDLNSSRGLTIDGQSVRRTVLRGTSEVWFGPEEAGVRVIFVAPGLNPRTVEKKGLPAWAIAVPVAIVALIALTALGLSLSRNSSTNVATTPVIPATILGNASPSSVPAANTAGVGPDLVALKKATVRIEGRFQLSSSERKRVDQAKKDEGVDPSAPDITGSGTIISADGLILTNAHVATPDLKKSGGDALPPIDTLMVALNRDGGDEPLQATEAAEVVVSDPDLDLAVIRISTDGNLPALPIGDDTTVHSGDELLVLGFPAVAGSGGVTVTRGVVGSFVSDKTMGTDRAWINTDAKIDPGNSGGLAANRDGAIIGVPTVICFEPIGSSKTGGRESRQNRVRAIDVAKPIIAAAKAGTTYESPGADRSACGQ